MHGDDVVERVHGVDGRSQDGESDAGFEEGGGRRSRSSCGPPSPTTASTPSSTSRTRVGSRLNAYYADTGTSLADLREEFRTGRTIDPGVVFDRAVDRGEIDATRLTRRVRELAFDLYRHEVLMTHRAVPDDVLASIVDEVVLPLVGAT